LYKRRKAVSEIVAAILLALIVVSIGGMVVLYFNSQRAGVQRTVFSQLSLAKNIQQQPVFHAYFTVYNTTDNTLTILINVGPGFLELVSVYVNDTLVNTEGSTVYLNGIILENPQKIVINKTGVNTIIVKPPQPLPFSPGDKFILKILSSVGTSDTVTGKVVS
jgi:hypothetical protein